MNEGWGVWPLTKVRARESFLFLLFFNLLNTVADHKGRPSAQPVSATGILCAHAKVTHPNCFSPHLELKIQPVGRHFSRLALRSRKIKLGTVVFVMSASLRQQSRREPAGNHSCSKGLQKVKIGSFGNKQGTCLKKKKS